jgi:CheY-like chemotaxis protein
MKTQHLGSAFAPKSHIPNILVVDDDLFVLESVAMMVNYIGFKAVTASDGRQAVEIFSQQPSAFSLVIMDIEMPRMNGIEATKQIRAVDPDAKVVLYTGHTKQDIWTVKPNAFLLKPFLHMELRQVLERILGEEWDPSCPHGVIESQQ